MVDIHPEHARAILENLSVGIALIDRSERLTWVNDYTASLLALAPSELLGRDATTLSLPYTPFASGGEGVQVRVEGGVIGITQRYAQTGGAGAILTLVDRSHALIGVLDALSGGSPLGMATSGALSRSAIRHRLEAEISRSRRYANDLSCITLRLCGPDIDARLVQLVRIIKGQLRWVDMIGQWQDDELLLVLPETDADAAAALRDKLALHVANELKPVLSTSTVELGAASWRRGDTVDQLVRRALTEVTGTTLNARCVGLG